MQPKLTSLSLTGSALTLSATILSSSAVSNEMACFETSAAMVMFVPPLELPPLPALAGFAFATTGGFEGEPITSSLTEPLAFFFVGVVDALDLAVEGFAFCGQGEGGSGELEDPEEAV